MRKYKYITVMICIALLMSQCVKNQAKAVPIAVPAAVYWAIGGGLVASGAYATTTDGQKAQIAQYWNDCSENIKHQWMVAAAAAPVVVDGLFTIPNSLASHQRGWIADKYPANGAQTLSVEQAGSTTSPITANQVNYTSGNYYTAAPYTDLSKNESGVILYRNGVVLAGFSYSLISYPNLRVSSAAVYVYENGHIGTIHTYTENGSTYGPYKRDLNITDSGTVTSTTVTQNYNMNIDKQDHWTGAHTGASTLSIPPEDNSLTDAQIEAILAFLTAGKTHTDIEQLDEKLDWYLDENGNIYTTPPGQGPRNPNDRKIGPVLPVVPPINKPDEQITTTETTEIETQTLPDGNIQHTYRDTITTITTHFNPDGSTTVTTHKETRLRDVVKSPDGTIISETTRPDTTNPPTDSTTTNPPGSQDINWEPLKQQLYFFKWKFPFCLPWDLGRAFTSLESQEAWDRKIPIRLPAGLAIGDAYNFDIDLSMWQPAVDVARKVELFLFDIGLIMIARKVMGGDV